MRLIDSLDRRITAALAGAKAGEHECSMALLEAYGRSHSCLSDAKVHFTKARLMLQAAKAELGIK